MSGSNSDSFNVTIDVIAAIYGKINEFNDFIFSMQKNKNLKNNRLRLTDFHLDFLFVHKYVKFFF